MLLSLSTLAVGQIFKRIPLTTEESKDSNLMAHYRLNYEYVMKEVFLYKNKRFVFNVSTDLAQYYTTGDWILNDEILTMTSEFTNKKLPVKISYRERSTQDSLIHRFAIVKDIRGIELPLTAILVNSDSVACFFGDMSCNRKYKTIDSIKVSIGELIRSDWIQIDASKNIIEVVIQSTIDFDRYKSLNLVFKRESGDLRLIQE